MSFLPPILVFVLGYLTHRAILSLFAGIVLAGFIAESFNVIESIKLISGTIIKNFELSNFFSISNFWHSWNLFICLFLLFLGIFIVLLERSGGAYAYREFAKKYVKNSKNAETASLILSLGLVMDDYLSALTVGSVMQPITDSKKIPRVKLAFLVDSMAAPLAILCPFSSWVAAIIGFLNENDIKNPFNAFINIYPYLFYSFVLLASTWFIVRKKISFGIMRRYEVAADIAGIEEKQDSIEHNPKHTTLLEFFLPIVTLLVSVLLGISYKGAAGGLFLAGAATVTICTIFFIIRGRIKIQQMPSIIWEGICLMFSAVLVLMLAWSLGDILRYNLHTGQNLANLLLDSVSVAYIAPLLFFANAFITFIIGSAWGTAAMMFPIAIPMVQSLSDNPQILFISLGAVLSGCVAGNHISPIADTTIMSSSSTGTKLNEHVVTQLQYALPGIIVTGGVFLLADYFLKFGYIYSFVLPIALAIILNMLILLILNRFKV